MTLRELHKRLGDIITENDKNPSFAKRNDLPLLVRLQRGTRKQPFLYPISYAIGSMISGTLNSERMAWMEIWIHDDKVMKL